MVPFVALLVSTVFAYLLAWALAPQLRSVALALRTGLAVMFTVTGISHFTSTREQFVRMIPPGLPSPELLVTVSGLAELAGAVGLLVPRLVIPAAAGLVLLLVAVFPANLYAAQTGALTDWWTRPLPRSILQLIYLAAVVTVLIDALQRRAGRLAALTDSGTTTS